MKIHNFGSDYASQRRKEKVMEETPVIEEAKLEENAGDKIQDGGEGTVETAIAETPESTKKNRKKKEARTEEKADLSEEAD